MSDDASDLATGGLDLIAQGINLTLEELKELGPIGAASAGRGFEDIALTGLELGHGGLTSTFNSFCERWEWGVRALFKEGNDFAQGVGLTAGTMHETEQYVGGSFKVLANSVSGNPYATEDEVTQMGWGELAENHALADPDYSKESFEKAGENIKQGYQDAGRDALTSTLLGPEASQRAAGMNDEQYEALLDEGFGPSPEERAQAEAQQGTQQGGDAG
ncbi:hypothetical protein OG453_27640 [Streptomyces sp. NBC_01381]|uniref:hypothetical protein n=1 Tax=Streptomyces sp. NBC_01381 TaxID=2903845 RepID=UPI002253A5C1|nr:hypothetical protein [Streptomyces sp. NBC_01381]MCX4670421.1 hypothetical protein [Streptomyces sp. NBC_01381]